MGAILEAYYFVKKTMVFVRSMFVTEKKSRIALVDLEKNFVIQEISWLADQKSDDYLYQQIVFKVLRKPKKFISHIQRIFLTYSLGMQEQLYAALVDLLWVLDGKGFALRERMFEPKKIS